MNNDIKIGILSSAIIFRGVIQKKKGRTQKNLIFEREKNEITNSKIGNELLAGAPPRKGWEQYYKV